MACVPVGFAWRRSLGWELSAKEAMMYSLVFSKVSSFQVSLFHILLIGTQEYFCFYSSLSRLSAFSGQTE